jgi:lipopolysaccharide transport system permease protein
MLRVVNNLYEYRELLYVLTWKNITLRYKQSYLGPAWAVFRPLVLVAIFMVVRSFVGIDSGAVPYALLTYCAMVPWSFFQDAASDSVGSVVNHANLIKKIYFPREVFPVASLLAKLVELGIGLAILGLLMLWYQWMPTLHALWIIPLLLYTLVIALTIGLAGAAVNVYARDMSQGVPLMLGMLMYLSPVIYPLKLVRQALLENHAAGDLSEAIYFIYTLNPMAGVIDGMQRALLHGQPPDWALMLPSAALIAVLLPLSYAFFKQAEGYFADVI